MQVKGIEMNADTQVLALHIFGGMLSRHCLVDLGGTLLCAMVFHG